jgi:hypothetical protein
MCVMSQRCSLRSVLITTLGLAHVYATPSNSALLFWVRKVGLMRWGEHGFSIYVREGHEWVGTELVGNDVVRGPGCDTLVVNLGQPVRFCVFGSCRSFQL